MAVHKKYNLGSKGSALGRGLDALISTDEVSTQGSSTINEIPIDLIVANPNQPRRDFDEQALQELAASIKEIGIIQPVTLRQEADGKYMIIAGERRFRATKLAEKKTIPAIIKNFNENEIKEIALAVSIGFKSCL